VLDPDLQGSPPALDTEPGRASAPPAIVAVPPESVPSEDAADASASARTVTKAPTLVSSESQHVPIYHIRHFTNPEFCRFFVVRSAQKVRKAEFRCVLSGPAFDQKSVGNMTSSCTAGISVRHSSQGPRQARLRRLHFTSSPCQMAWNCRTCGERSDFSTFVLIG
jgi:hypothetical protein